MSGSVRAPFYVMDRGYLDFERLYRLHQAASFFVTRAKSNFKFKRVYSRRVDRSTGLLCDQEVQLLFSTPSRRKQSPHVLILIHMLKELWSVGLRINCFAFLRPTIRESVKASAVPASALCPGRDFLEAIV